MQKMRFDYCLIMRRDMSKKDSLIVLLVLSSLAWSGQTVSSQADYGDVTWVVGGSAVTGVDDTPLLYYVLEATKPEGPVILLESVNSGLDFRFTEPVGIKVYSMQGRVLYQSVDRISNWSVKSLDVAPQKLIIELTSAAGKVQRQVWTQKRGEGK